MSGSLRDDQSLEALGRRLAEYDRRLRSLETLPGGDSEHNGTGMDSTAVGTSADASATRSTAVGDYATASATEATALGASAIASGHGDTAVGEHANATGSYGVALGWYAVAGEEGIAIGDEAESGSFNVAIGYFAGPRSGDAAYTGGGAVNIGQSARSRGENGIAIGYSADTFGADAIAIGDSTTATGVRSIAIGKGASAPSDDQGVMKIDALELAPSSGGSESALILHDSAGVRWKVTVDTTGHLTTALA